MTTNVQSVVSKPNGKGAPKVSTKNKALRTTSLVNPDNVRLTEEQALKIGFEYGRSMAGRDGSLTKVLKQHNSKEFRQKLVDHIAAGYYVDKLDYSEEKAFATVDLAKFNKDKQDEKHRTKEEENIHVSARMLVSRAMALAGVTDPEDKARQEKATATKEANKRAAEALEAKRDEAWEIVHPTVDESFDVNAALNNLVSRIRSLMNEHSARITGDTGSKWREWIAKAPKVK